MRICICYDGVFPCTLGGADRWYRNVAERLAAMGHEVTYLTARQWQRGHAPVLAGVRLVPVAPNIRARGAGGRRRRIFPLVFGAGIAWHLLRHGRNYDVVHMAAFPYTTLLAAVCMRPVGGYRLIVDWHEAFTRAYWQELAGRWPGWLAWQAQRLCARLPHAAVAFSELHARRVQADGYRGEVTLLRGQYPVSTRPRERMQHEPLIVFAGRHVPEKRVLHVVQAIALARSVAPVLRGVLFGDGEERYAAIDLVRTLGQETAINVAGMVEEREVTDAMRRALCLVHPSRREGYGFAVIEALAVGTPAIVVAGEDNAAVEFIEPGKNGFIVPSADPQDLAEAILTTYAASVALHISTQAWFERNALQFSLERSVERLLRLYAPAGDCPKQACSDASPG
jgi:glycosyltransferase involved in cell wall biosynthesis